MDKSSKIKVLKAVLLLDEDRALLASLTQAFSQDVPFTLLTATDERGALSVLEQRPVAMVVVDLDTLGDDPLRPIYYLRGRYPLVPLGVTGRTIEPKLEQALEGSLIPLLRKPYEPGQLRAIIEQRLEQGSGFVGTVADFELIDTLQLVHMGRHTRRLLVAAPQGKGELVFRQGQLIHARAGSLEGTDAFLEMVSWTGGAIQSLSVPEDTPTTISSNWVHLAMEGLRRLDEQRHREKLQASAGARSTPVAVSLRTMSPSLSEEVDSFIRETSSVPAPAMDPLADTLLDGRYHLGQQLECTPLTRRYQAELDEGSKQVWVDVLDDRLVSPEQEGREQTLAEWVRRYNALNHPSLLRLLDHGQLLLGGRPFFYLVSEPAPGVPLSTRLGEPLPVEQAISWLEQIAWPLREVHQQGLFHGCLYPGSIVVEQPQQDGPGRAQEASFKLLWTGLLPALQPSRSQGFEQPWAIFGAPLYLAPEQISNDAVPGPRSDIYALGMLLHQLLGGHSPMRQATLSSLLAAKLTGREPRVSLPLPEPRRSKLERLIQRCLARDPQLRPRSIEELLQALDGSLRDDVPDVPPERRTTTPEPYTPSEDERVQSAPPASLHGATPAGDAARVRAAAFIESRLTTPFNAVGLPTPQRSRDLDENGPRSALSLPLEEQRTGLPNWLIVVSLLVLFACGLAAGVLLLDFLH